jgi:hypothetical protein
MAFDKVANKVRQGQPKIMGLIARHMVEIIVGEVIHAGYKDTRLSSIYLDTVEGASIIDGFFMTKMNLHGLVIVKWMV